MQNAIIISRCSSNDQRQDVYRQQQELLSTYGTQYNIVKGFTYYKSGTKNYEVNTEILEFAIKNNVNQLLRLILDSSHIKRTLKDIKKP